MCVVGVSVYCTVQVRCDMTYPNNRSVPGGHIRRLPLKCWRFCSTSPCWCVVVLWGWGVGLLCYRGWYTDPTASLLCGHLTWLVTADTIALLAGGLFVRPGSCAVPGPCLVNCVFAMNHEAGFLIHLLPHHTHHFALCLRVYLALLCLLSRQPGGLAVLAVLVEMLLLSSGPEIMLNCTSCDRKNCRESLRSAQSQPVSQVKPQNSGQRHNVLHPLRNQQRMLQIRAPVPSAHPSKEWGEAGRCRHW